MFLDTKVLDCVLQVVDRNLYCFKIFFTFLHNLLDFAEVRHHASIDVFTYIALLERCKVYFAIYDLKKVLTKIVIDTIVLAIERIEFLFIPIELRVNSFDNFLLEQLELITQRSDYIV